MKKTIYNDSELWDKWFLTGDMSVRNQIAQNNMPLVHFIVNKRYYHRRFEKEDLFQEGFLGLLDAIKYYKRGFRFSTYACKCINRAIFYYIMRKGLVATPQNGETKKYYKPAKSVSANDDKTYEPLFNPALPVEPNSMIKNLMDKTLTDEEKDLVVRSVFMEDSGPDIAKDTGGDRKSVHYNLGKALKAMKEELELDAA